MIVFCGQYQLRQEIHWINFRLLVANAFKTSIFLEINNDLNLIPLRISVFSTPS